MRFVPSGMFIPWSRLFYNRDPHAGLWKQIALGIVVGYLALGLISAVGWAVFARFALGGLQIAVP